MEPSEKQLPKEFGFRETDQNSTTGSSSNAVSKHSTNEGTRETASINDNSYRVRLAMVIMLRAFTLRGKGKLSDFKISMEDPNAGKLDDVVFRYSVPSTPQAFACVYIQAKQKQTSDSRRKGPLSTEVSWFTKWNSKASFSIPMYFKSYINRYDESLKGSHTYILCTNASLDENMKNYLIARNHETDHILSFCDEIGAVSYSLNNRKEYIALVDALRLASVEKLGQTIAVHVKGKKQIELNTTIFKLYVNLIANCLDQHDPGTFQFNEKFRRAENTSLIGNLRHSFEEEYLNQTTKNEIHWEDIKIMTEQSFSESILANAQHRIHDETQYYEAVDAVIEQFYDSFLLVCGSMKETELSHKILDVLTTETAVNEDILLQQISSNDLRNVLIFAHHIEIWSDDYCRKIVRQLFPNLVEYLINERHLDILSCHRELDCLTVLEFCSKRNMLGLFKQFLSRMYCPGRISTQETNQLLQVASENNAHDIIAYLKDHTDQLLPQLKIIASSHYHIFIVKYCIQANHWYLFKHIFQTLCFQLRINWIDDTEIVFDDYNQVDGSVPSIDKNQYPKHCCVRSSTNVPSSLPEYDEKDILHEGYLIEALLATAVHEGNLRIVKYIVQKTNKAITNKTIVMVMRLLPKGDEVCHEKSMSAFAYLLKTRTACELTDDEGRNLLHMTAQNGCFFMLRCLIAKGFDPTVTNTRNGWNVFHYVAFNQDEDRTEKILEFLLLQCSINWFDDLEHMVDSNYNLLKTNANQNTLSANKLTSSKISQFLFRKKVIQNMDNSKTFKKQQHGILAMFAIFSKEDLTKLLSEKEQQEALQCMREVTLGNAKSSVIQDVQDDIPQFSHRIFAEYFAASWLYDNQRIMRRENFFRSWMYWNSKMHRTRDFLNRIIVKNSKQSDIHMAVINQSEQQVRQLLFMDSSVALVKDAVGRLPLHVAVMYPSERITLSLIEGMPLESIYANDDLFQKTALDYAFQIGYTTLASNLLAAEVMVNENTLFEKSFSHHLSILLGLVHYFGSEFDSNEHFKMITNRLRIVEFLLYDRYLRVYSHHRKLDSLTALEFCSKYNMIEIFKLLVSQSNVWKSLSVDVCGQLFQIASVNKAHDIVQYFTNSYNLLFPQIENVADLISAIKSSIKKNQINAFKPLFQLLCFQLKIHVVDDTDIVVDEYVPDDGMIIPLDKNQYPKICCARSSENVRLPLPEYDEKDILHEGYVIEALLATAVHEGNLQMVKYIVQKTNMTITNRLIVMVMRLLPKRDDICHEKSMSAFIYLLNRTTYQRSTDDEGRNLLHMTAQNGCFFMLRCLIPNGFDPTVTNARNGWNVFHYVAFNQDEDRTDKILEFLLAKCDMNWFDDLENLINSNQCFFNVTSNQLTKNTNKLAKNIFFKKLYFINKVKKSEQNANSTNKFNKQQHGVLAIFDTFSEEKSIDLLSDQEQPEIIQCMREIYHANRQTAKTKEIRDDSSQFTHPIFADYFAASWLLCNKHLMRSKRFFRSRVYWNDTIHRTRDFLNRMIIRDSDGCDIHMAVINQSEQKVREFLSKDPSVAFVKDAVGRLSLHVAVMYSSECIVKLLVSKMNLESINTKDELFQWTALDYAFAIKYSTAVKNLLDAGATVNEDTLLQQILSNDLAIVLTVAHSYGTWLSCYEHTETIASRLYIRTIECLVYNRYLDVFSRLDELDFLTVLEFCSKHNMVGIFKLLVSQWNILDKLSIDMCGQLIQIASENKAHDIVAFFVDGNNMLLPQMRSVMELISTIKCCIKQNRMVSFKGLFQQLCFQLKISMIDDADIIIDDLASVDGNIPPLDRACYPKSCCVRSSENVRLSLPEYDEKDVLHEGYVIEALLATAVHEGNLGMVKYIVQKSNMPITNRVIVLVMRLLPKEDDICHEKSMSAFTYLLEKTTDRDSIDDEGRNLLHMTAKHGCFFMLRCLMAKGFVKH